MPTRTGGAIRARHALVWVKTPCHVAQRVAQGFPLMHGARHAGLAARESRAWSCLALRASGWPALFLEGHPRRDQHRGQRLSTPSLLPSRCLRVTSLGHTA